MSKRLIRSGVVAKKLGMTSVFSEEGALVPVTMLHVFPCTVISKKTSDVDGYDAVQLGYDPVSPARLKKPVRGIFEKKGLGYFKKIKEFRVVDLLDVGFVVDSSHFSVGQFIDVTAKSIGKGFAGGMKRHNFGGLRASHGVSVSHRSHGSTGNRQDPGKVFKGKKMAGHLGNENTTIQNLRIHSIDFERNLLFVKGAVPGNPGAFVSVRDSIKKTGQQK